MPEYLDPTRYLGNMQNHQKMYEFERDIIRVKNPLSSDFTFIYDSMPITVAAKSTRDMERYLWRRFLWDMMGHIFNQLTEERFDKAHDAFTRTHPDVIDDPYLVNEKIWLRLPRFDNPDFQKKIHDDCFVGVVSKFGANRILPPKPHGRLDPTTPLFQQLINGDDKLIEAVSATTPETAAPSATQPLPVEEATI